MKYLLATICGATVSAMLLFCAFLFTGAGHGWGSGVAVSMFAVVAWPLVAIASVTNNAPLRLTLAVVAMAIFFAGDIALVIATRGENRTDFSNVVWTMLVPAAAWFVLWAGGQIASAYIVFRILFTEPDIGFDLSEK